MPAPPGGKRMTDSSSNGDATDLAREERFMNLFLSNERRIYAYVLALVPHREDAEDLVQDTSRVMWQKFDEFTGAGDFAAWGISIARYRVLDYRRKLGVRRAVLSDRTIEAIAEQVTRVGRESSCRLDALLLCMAKLRDPDRELMRLRYHVGASTREVAAQVGRSPDSVYKSLNRIHNQLLLCIRDELSKEKRE
jgi:RNA polymerase sigma-70 factor, ECF subfamily